jgi:signal peptidase I
MIASALVPGVGQLVLREKQRARIYFGLLVVWLLLFLPPFRIPRFYAATIVALFAAAALMIFASCQALRSRAWNRSPGSYWWLFLVVPLACVTACVYWGMAIRVSGFRDFSIPSTSMEPTIMPGDSILADMHCYRYREPAEESMIIFHSPTTPGVILIKRVIAVGGDTIQSVDGQVFLNGELLNEAYVKHTGDAPDELMNFGPTVIPPRKLFVMGDNRDVSLDSRMAVFGLIDESAVMGKALYILRAANDRTGKSLR